MKKITADDIIGIALETGFMISTQFGQEVDKLMPVSDRKTLIQFARNILKEVKEKE